VNPIRLGLVIDQDITVGGGYQQSLNAILLASKLPAELAEVICFCTHKANVASIKKYGINAHHLRITVLEMVLMRIRRFVLEPRISSIVSRIIGDNILDKKFSNRGVDLVYFLSPSGLAIDLDKTNYITTVWDLCHRDHPEFPEVRWQKEFERREKNYHQILPRAVSIIVDSQYGMDILSKRYAIDQDRIKVIPFEPGSVSRMSVNQNHAAANGSNSNENLGIPYVFYPAQFWSHKNHVYLLDGLKELENVYSKKVGAIFCGSDKGNLEFVLEHADNLGIADRVRFLGFLDDSIVRTIYRGALALVMPTYFGPTNIPPLEAFYFGIPVLYPDMPGLREQVGDGGLLIDLSNPRSMADGLFRVMTCAKTKDQLVKRGREKLEEIQGFDRLGVLCNIIEKYRRKRACWR
jgi:glycosyltransferase involved in cell wall biosynthesis